MATCKDCIHEDLCGTFTRPCMPDEANASERLCKDFKNKADYVEVVRCKDCKRCFEKRTKRNKQLMRFCMRMDGNEYQVNANDFCSYGERMEKE